MQAALWVISHKHKSTSGNYDQWCNVTQNTDDHCRISVSNGTEAKTDNVIQSEFMKRINGKL